MVSSDLSSLFEFLPIGAYRCTAAGKPVRVNAALVQLLGYDSEAQCLAGMAHLVQGLYVLPERQAQFHALLARDARVQDFVSEMISPVTGHGLWVNENAHLVRHASGEVAYYEGTVEDISLKHRSPLAVQASELAQSEARWKLALDSIGDGVWDWHIQSGKEFYSRRFKEMYGYTEDEAPSKANEANDFDQLTHPDDVPQMLRDRDAHFSGETPIYANEHRIRCKDGSWKWVLSRGMVISRDAQGKPLRMIGTHTDITSRKAAEALIWQQANFDPLTGLPNRRMLRVQLEKDLQQVRETGDSLAVLFIDLDHFKEVNDTLGHDHGDALLVQAARRIKSCVGPRDTVARMGGDEFTVVLHDTPQRDQLEQLLQTMLDQLCGAFALGAEQVFVSASIGVTLCPQDATEVEGLLKHADQALYVAKGAGRNRFSFFTAALQEAAQERARLASDLRLAVSQQQFALVYQPIVGLADGQVHKAEALLRWHHPQRGLINPGQFIGIAESTGLIIDIGEWVFLEAARQVKRWREAYGADFQISVNRSPVQFHREARAQVAWIDHLHLLGLPGNSITVEITEGVLLDTNAMVTQQLGALRAAGLAISLDDFGTGYSSLTYLQKFGIDFIKIDQSFVRNLKPGATDLALCKAIIVMAHELGMKVIAEGVETTGQRDLLLQMGCDFGQGFLFARPMGVAAFEAYMATVA